MMKRVITMYSQDIAKPYIRKVVTGMHLIIQVTIVGSEHGSR